MGDNYRDAIALSRRNHKSRSGVTEEGSGRTLCEERRTLRSEYFKKKAKGHTQTPSWRRLDA